MAFRTRRSKTSKRKGTFDPEDTTKVKHTRLGVWDLYEEIKPELVSIPGSSRLESILEIKNNLPYVWRMLKDIAGIRSCWFLLVLFVLVEYAMAMIPAITLWCANVLAKFILAILTPPPFPLQVLGPTIDNSEKCRFPKSKMNPDLFLEVQTAVDERKVDKHLLYSVALGRFLSALAYRFLAHAKMALTEPLNARIKQFYSGHVYRALVRLDVPTYDDPAVQRTFDETFPRTRSSIAWDTVVMASRVSSTFVRLVSEISVLLAVLQDQRDGPLLAFLCFAQSALGWMSVRQTMHHHGVWAATTKNEDFVRMEGLKQLAGSSLHRKELVAGGIWEYCLSLYRACLEQVGDLGAMDFYESLNRYRMKQKMGFSAFQEPFKELPQIIFTLRAVQYPASIPISVASLNLVTNTTQTFTHVIFSLIDETRSVADQLSRVRNLYEISNIPNKVVDGKEPYPENQQSLMMGMSIEFKNVSFKYPGSDSFALRNVSFKIERGQLCVIVGSNGSGKSTILKLISRLHDPSEGQILIDGRDIRSLKLDDLRRALSVLFQDYTHFPLSIKDNIGLGDPDHADDEERILQAATLGGAKEFIDRLPDGFNTYLERPVRDYYSGIPEGTKTLFGREVDYSGIRIAGGMGVTTSSSLSGGQMQRIALSRTFMRSLVSEPKVALLLFDEPSASLDPTAEHDLFERLRQLRGNKTMIFSSHRFGNLTRHADLILYMNDSVVVEEGTHDALIKKDGEYARIWKLQAQAFLP